jgi:hypothetical protein
VNKLAADLEMTKHGFMDGDVIELEKQLGDTQVLSTKTSQTLVG